jgi:hypothetical protein
MSQESYYPRKVVLDDKNSKEIKVPYKHVPWQVCSMLCSAVQCSVLGCPVLYWGAVQCSVLKCSAVYRSVMWRSAVQCDVVGCSTWVLTAPFHGAVDLSGEHVAMDNQAVHGEPLNAGKGEEEET